MGSIKLRLRNILVLLCVATSAPLLGREPAPCYPCVCDQGTCDQRSWLDAGFVSYWLDGFDGPALVSQSSAGTDRADAGVLGLPTTSVVRSGELGDDKLFGFRIRGGHYLDAGNLAISGSFLWAGADSEETFPSEPNSIIARPFFNSAPGINAPDAELVNFPGVVSGTLGIATNTNIFSGNIGFQRRISCCADPCCCKGRRFDVLFGYRGFLLNDELEIIEQLEPAGGLLTPGTQIGITDSFETRNSFHGVEFGLLSSFQRQRWEFNIRTHFGFGNIRQRVKISGSTVTTVPGAGAASQPYGFLAAPSNIGTYTRDRFGVLTDAQFRAGYWLSRRAQLYVGYNLLFLNNVTRAGNAVDTRLNATQIDPNQATVGPEEPRVSWSDESLLLHGISAGLEFRF